MFLGFRCLLNAATEATKKSNGKIAKAGISGRLGAVVELGGWVGSAGLLLDACTGAIVGVGVGAELGDDVGAGDGLERLLMTGEVALVNVKVTELALS